MSTTASVLVAEPAASPAARFSPAGRLAAATTLVLGAGLQLASFANGLLMTAVAPWRSRAVPRGAVLLIAAFVVVDFLLQQGLAGDVIQFVAACWIAWAVLRARQPAPAT
jgi:hypothetical protein